METKRETLGRLGVELRLFELVDFCPPPRDANVNTTLKPLSGVGRGSEEL